MNTKATKGLRSRAGLFCSTSVAAFIALGFPGGALGQEVPAQNSAASGSAVETVVVSSTRIVRDGYQAPTPTSVIGAAEIDAKAPGNIADFVNEMPSLAGSTTPAANVGSLSAGLIGVNALNLRSLGSNRTLVLLDGQRVGSSTLTGLVDINDFPQALVKRVDVVTGGASADWGSDAVAGVVNFVLDKDFTGLKAEVQGGLTTFGDDGNYNLALTAGTGFLNGRGHVLVSLEDNYNAGITGIGNRNWFNQSKLFINPAFTATNGQPQLLALPNAGFATATPGGIITSGPLKGTYFGPGGTPTQFNYGSIVSGNIMVGGDSQYSEFAQSGDLDPQLSRQNAFFRTSFDVTEHFQIYGQASYGKATSNENALDQFNFGNITIKSDNAFIPSAVATSAAALGVTSFTLGTFSQDLGPVTASTKRTSERMVLGAKGDFDALGSNWGWDVYGQQNINDSYVSSRISVTSNFNAAIDSVRNSSGAIVCRTTLTNPTNGCVPYDAFGTGVNTSQAVNYVLGTAWGRTHLTERVVAANLHGNPITDWAGPISVAAGFEHREEGVSGTNDPLSNTNSYFAGNFHSSFGSYEVNEGYFETVVPLLKDQFLAKSLDFNGAIRETGYSTSGVVTTYKAGLTYSPIDDITFRATRSRDLRAPNLADLFQAGQTSTTNFVDPFRNNASTSAFQVTSGNLALRPEKSDSTGVGIVVQPNFIPGFSASVDYYDIHIGDAIETVNAATVLTQCFQGFAALCPQITRNSSGIITSVVVQPINAAKQIARGLDFEASYHTDLQTLTPFLDGELGLRGLATNYLENSISDGITPAYDAAGTNGTNGTLRNTLPSWRYLATVSWDRDPWMVSFTARGFSAGVINTSYVQCTSSCPTSTVANMTVNNNQLPGQIYFDGNFAVELPYQTQAYLSVDNIANTPPFQMPFGTSIGAAPLSVNPLISDVIGRSFRFGFRFKM